MAETETKVTDDDKPKPSRAKHKPEENPLGDLDRAAQFYPRAHPGNADVAPLPDELEADGAEKEK